MKRAFGRGFAPDKRDNKYPIKAPAISRWARTWQLGPVTDQLATPACVGHAWANWLAASPVRQRPIAPFGIYKLAKFFDEWQGEAYDGTSVRGAAKVLSTAGHVVRYEWAFDLAPAVAHVLEVGPVVIGVNWYAGMMDTDTSGFIHPTGRLQGGHAVLVYGVDTRRGYAKIRNSWGAQWGIGGNCKVRLSDLQALILDDGECCTAIEVKAEVK